MALECIIVADDHPVFRDGVCSLIRGLLPDAEVHGLGTFEEARDFARAAPTPPSMFILDLTFSHKKIRSELEALRREFDCAAIIVVSMADDPNTVQTLLSYGINGFVHKSVAGHELCRAIVAARQGDVVIRLPLADAINERSPFRLSDRQTEVLRLVAEGKSNKEIAVALSISPFTVRIHVSAMLRALGVSTRAAAVSKGISEGLLNIGGE